MRYITLLAAILCVCFAVVSGHASKKKAPSKPTIIEKLTLDDVLFERGSDRIKPEARPLLEELVKKIKAAPEEYMVFVEGYTDDTGTLRVNMELSQKRAEAVANILKTEMGVEPTRVHARGFGPERPAVANDSEANRAKNRRVEILVSNYWPY